MRDYQVTNYGMCGECKHYNYCEMKDIDRQIIIRFQYACGNEKSQHYAHFTSQNYTCEHFEQRGVE